MLLDGQRGHFVSHIYCEIFPKEENKNEDKKDSREQEEILAVTLRFQQQSVVEEC